MIYAAKISKAETRIDFSKTATEVHNHIRGLSPFPGAWFELTIAGKPERVKVLSSVVETAGGETGTALFDDLIDVDVTVDRLGDTSMLSSYTVSRDGQLLAEGSFRHVFIEVATKAKKPIPDEIRSVLAGYTSADGTA